MKLQRIGLAAAALAVAAGLLATQVGAAKTPVARSATINTYSVPGVINGASGMIDRTPLATVISCTNGGTAAASVTVSLFQENGTAGATATTEVPAKGSRNFATTTVAGWPVNVNMSEGLLLTGSAGISAPTGVFCTAFVTEESHNPALVMMSLPVIKRTAQKGV